MGLLDPRQPITKPPGAPVGSQTDKPVFEDGGAVMGYRTGTGGTPYVGPDTPIYEDQKTLPTTDPYHQGDTSLRINPNTGEKDASITPTKDYKYGKDYWAYREAGGSSNPEKFYAGTAMVPEGYDYSKWQGEVVPGESAPIGFGLGDTPYVGGNPDSRYYEGGRVRANINDPEGLAPHTREVQDDELVENRIAGLLSSDSKYMQDARRQGLEQANAMGGLGGTLGVGAAQTSALRAALPIAQQDAQTAYQTASENMQSLNQWAQLNHQRATQVGLANLDANTRIMTTNIGASAQIAATRLQTAAQRDIANLDAHTKMKVTEMQGIIQQRLADTQFKYQQVLNNAQYAAELSKTQMQGEYGLEGERIRGSFQQDIQRETNALQREQNYTTAATNIYGGYLDRIASLNGVEMDDNARKAAIETITQGSKAHLEMLNKLYPELDLLTFDW